MSDSVIELKGLLLPSVVSIAAAWQMANFARRVGAARSKFKIEPPAVEGDEGFVRVFRAQQNSLEFVPIIFPNLWVASIFFHPVPAAIVSVGYLYARRQYFEAYSRSADERLGPFKQIAKITQLFFLMSFAGIGNFVLKTYLGYDIPGWVGNYVSQLRIAPFKLSAKFLKLLFLMSAAGVSNFVLKAYLGYDIPGWVSNYVSQLRS